jgi:hypothetical protein
MVMKKILTAGCSFTKDNYQKTWANYLADELGYLLHNIAARGAGIDFITNRILHECLKEKYDLVMVMLPSVDRMDLYVDATHPMKQQYLDISSWQDGKSPDFVTLDGKLTKNYGYAMSGGEIRGLKKYWFKYYYNETAALLSYWSKIYLLENFFKNHQINYKFHMAYDKHSLAEQQTNASGDDKIHDCLWNNMDWDNFIFFQTNKGFLSFSRDKDFEIIRNHPVSMAHESWVNEILLPNLANENLNK